MVLIKTIGSYLQFREFTQEDGMFNHLMQSVSLHRTHANTPVDKTLDDFLEHRISLKDAHRYMRADGEMTPMWAYHESISDLFMMRFLSHPVENPDWPFEKLMPLAYSKTEKKYIPQSEYFNLSDKSDYEIFGRNRKFRVCLSLHMTPVKILNVEQARSIEEDDFSWCEILDFFPEHGDPEGEYAVRELLMNARAMERYYNLKMQYVALSLSCFLFSYESIDVPNPNQCLC